MVEKPNFSTGALKASLLVCLFSILVTTATAETAIPPLTGPVVDTANVLSTGQRTTLANAMQILYQQSGKQLQVLTIPSLAGEPIESYSIRVAEAWKIGGPSGTGVILLIATKDRRLRIEVGDGLEGDLTDAQAGRIINDAITPYFKRGDFNSGVTIGLMQIASALGEKLPITNFQPRRIERRSKGSILNVIFWIIIIIFFIFPRMFGGGRTGLLTGMILGSAIGSGRGSFGGGSFGGGWSGGGGGFSGGGASGSW